MQIPEKTLVSSLAMLLFMAPFGATAAARTQELNKDGPCSGRELFVAQASPGYPRLPMYIAKFGGFFANTGLDVKVTVANSGADATAALTVCFLVFYYSYSGARSVDRDLIDVVRLMGSNGRELFRYVIIPSAAAWIFTGLRLAVPYALIGAIVGEIVASDRGVGYLIRQSAGYYNTAGVFAALIVLMIISSMLNYFVSWFETRTTRWRPLP